ncbi:MAG: YbaN family protein [Acidimicrobiia bacterium]|nr:YbaN family protein [Acidimicrobiia bacterium]
MTTRIAKNPILRGIYMVLGFLCLGLAFLGFLPFIPVFDMLALAAFFFAMSNERLYNWVLNHPRFGGAIRDYRAGLGLTASLKRWAIIAVSLSFAATIVFFTDAVLAKVLMALLAVGICAFIYTRPTREATVDADSARSDSEPSLTVN